MAQRRVGATHHINDCINIGGLDPPCESGTPPLTSIMLRNHLRGRGRSSASGAGPRSGAISGIALRTSLATRLMISRRRLACSILSSPS